MRELECEDLEAPHVDEDDSEVCLAHDMLEVLCHQEPEGGDCMSSSESTALRVDCRETVVTSPPRLAGSPVPESPMSELERKLWLSNTNPVSLSTGQH